MSWTRNIFIALLALAFFQIAYYYPQMPEVMASHFNGAGIPNGWASKAVFFALYAAIVFLLAFVFLYVPKWSEKQSRFGLKLPNKDYWLAPARIEQTQSFIKRQMVIIGVAHLLLTLLVIQMAINANFSESPVLDRRVSWILISYFLVLALWLIHFFFHFRKTG